MLDEKIQRKPRKTWSGRRGSNPQPTAWKIVAQLKTKDNCDRRRCILTVATAEFHAENR